MNALLFDLVSPSEPDRTCIEVLEVTYDQGFQLGLRGHPDPSEDGLGQLCESFFTT